MRVLVTGSSGAIGRTVVSGLSSQGHALRGVDRAEADTELTGLLPLGAVVGDVTDPVIAASVVSDVDAVVHLAGHPDEATLPESLASHAHTTAALLDAMVEAGVPRMVFASSNHAVGLSPRTDLLAADARPRPDTFYGVAKVAAEGLLSLYADRFGIAAVALRIGSFLPEPTTVRELSTWLSYGDAVRLVDAALTAPVEGFAAVYGISANSRAWWDLEAGRRLGYEPRDDAEAYADQIGARSEDEGEGAYAGGPFAVMPLGKAI
ncbi:NAD(P)-dependent oxidoreductase [Mumia sp. zg.B21]|uniref:NAD-dependent epimerase/dehydratase family protein n=1 Tax=unclassified Mumia TaxID=2621872 RepID=UPI001C6F5D58|nr:MULTISPECIES: NAD(P)-dependent oxidoreductase [unclassified Mumia]MBW9209167.1 NAD(P)-dependent oxidoreductase [Mumia sp. zg.B21]MDD9347357.1 NAD(P)-dependent oxidoreductase [Mumia sp.]